jgi:hypothetical protein
MSENTTNKNAGNNDIDLLDLFNRMGRTMNRWAQSVGKAILISIVFLIRRWLPLTFTILAAIGVSYFLKITSPSIYTSDLVLRSNVIGNEQMISYINRLQNLDKKSLSETLKLSEETVDNIIGINACWIIDLNKDTIPDYVDYKNNHNIYDTTNIRMEDRFDIQVRIKSPQELNQLKDGLLNYIGRDPLFQQRNSIRLAQKMELIERLNLDISQLDSLQKVKYFEETRKRPDQNGGQIVFLQEQNTQLLYRDIYSLYSIKQKLETEIDLYKGIVTVLNDFSLPTTRVNGLLYYAKQVIPLFFFITLLFLLLFANQKKLKEIYKKYQ